MVHNAAALRLANIIVEITDPTLPRWYKEQLEKQARVIAKNQIKKEQS